MQNFGDWSPTRFEENTPNLHPAVALCGMTVVILCYPPGNHALVTPLPPALHPEAAPADPPPLQLPETQLRLRITPLWRFRYGQRAQQAPRTPLPPGPSAALRWLLVEWWLQRIRSGGTARWLVELLSAHFYFSIFGGVPWRTLMALRHCLRILCAQSLPCPWWMQRVLDSEPC